MERSASSLLSWLLVPVAAMLVASAVSLPQRPYTGLVLRGTEVITVLPGSPGERAGARAGDRLRPASGAAGTRDFDRLLTSASPGHPLTLDVEPGQFRELSAKEVETLRRFDGRRRRVEPVPKRMFHKPERRRKTR